MSGRESAGWRPARLLLLGLAVVGRLTLRVVRWLERRRGTDPAADGG